MQTSLLRSICNSEQLWILGTFGCPDLVEMQHLSSPTMSYRALGKLEKNISYTHTVERVEHHTWVAVTSVTGLFYFLTVATPCYTSLWRCDTAHLREVPCLPVSCAPFVVTALCLRNILGRWPVIQKPYHWVILCERLTQTLFHFANNQKKWG